MIIRAPNRRAGAGDASHDLRPANDERSPRYDRLPADACERLHEAAVSTVERTGDLIDELGPDGSFLDTPHTFAHFRERWYPTLIERASRGAWSTHGSLTMVERAAARVDALLAGHKPPPLPDAVAAAIDEILKRASANSGLSPH